MREIINVNKRNERNNLGERGTERSEGVEGESKKREEKASPREENK